ncbi:hypothetical protein DFJ74DRAFT_685122 [Hyaloraphidium curvatum]|nr:hypothetical protein DFJ74DRAFT_685122 [Hyaloraphidium curvatum]
MAAVAHESAPAPAPALQAPPAQARQFASGTHGFLQAPPELGNQYEDDNVLRNIVRRHLDASPLLAEIDADLSRFGARVVQEDMLDACARAEQELPRLEQHDAWGRRVDRLVTSEGWRFMRPIAASEGLIAIAYERNQWREHSRTYQFAKQYLYGPSAALFGCPLAMTDGAARLFELNGAVTPAQKEAERRLKSREPALFRTAGQWMTERPGGGDVSMTETEAVPAGDGTYRVYGFKWFSSATDADMTVLLARMHDGAGRMVPGSGGLSLFFAEMRDPQTGQLNGVRIQKLKNKLGTKPLPTAELELSGMKAELIGKQNRGTATIATVLNITRIHTAVSACCFLRRSLAIARDYADRRVAFGKPISQHPMHLLALAQVDLYLRAITQLTFHAIKLLGSTEYAWHQGRGEDADEALLLRLLTPVTKVFASRNATQQISECIEALGGQGYIEDVGIARLWRDSMVLIVWEGTSNILAHDLLRVLRGQPKALQVWAKAMERMVSAQPPASAPANAPEIFSSSRAAILSATSQLVAYITRMPALPSRLSERGGRDLLMSFGRITSAALLFEQAIWSCGRPADAADARADLAALRRWCAGKEEWGGPLLANGIGREAAEASVEDEDELLAMARAPGRAKL